ncbi:hypothetical protein NA56DRAFT_279434 [Hyaloscypha hepaticicola]|uniref:Uncharacterized protein n=1 Tax=Hyaloscypha hepaticicola TaxID=2082293 RepID=A0A2J6PST8_9HELO|nr:hypothetical protein NA56DRAFT_279434 [Hyaloscypha hepaticicola]
MVYPLNHYLSQCEAVLNPATHNQAVCEMTTQDVQLCLPYVPQVEGIAAAVQGPGAEVSIGKLILFDANCICLPADAFCSTDYASWIGSKSFSGTCR